MRVIPEQWKQHDENYWVSDLGRVKRVYKNGKEYYLKPVRRDEKDTRYRVKMNGKYISLQRLIWETFRGKIPDGYCVTSKYRTMNELYNLQLIPRIKRGELSGKSRRKKVINLDTGVVYPSVRSVEKYLPICHTSVTYYCQGKIKKPIYNLEFFDEDKSYKKTLKFIRS